MNILKSLWQNTVTLPQFPSLEGDTQTHVLIIGGGLAGILTAYMLGKSGIPYLLVERSRICSGTTHITTAKITYQHGLIYSKILKEYGADTAKAYLLANKAAFDEYAAICKSIDCDYMSADNYVYETADKRALEDEMAALDRIGFSAKLCETHELPISTVGAVRFQNQAHFHPLKLIAALAKDLNIHENTWVKDIDSKRVITDKGTVTADKIIVATHFPFINTHGAYFLKLYQHRSYVIALNGAPTLNGMYVDASGTGLSFRPYNDYLLLGGGAHRTGKKGGGYDEIRRFAYLNYPRVKEACAWSAQDCMSLDGIPYIGRYSKNTPNMYVASGFNKWGMTGSMLSAMLLRDQILGKANDYAFAFKPSRSIMHKQLLLNIAETTKNLLTPTSPRCSHLGCALKWNSAEHSWDCACHGSRFTRNGEILDNPANKIPKLPKK